MHEMGNRVSAGKVILSNGSILSYDRPLTVAELMLDHPQEVVVQLEGGMKKASSPLPADHTLHFHNLYLMLPKLHASHFLTKTLSALNTKPLLSYTGVLPLFVRICRNSGGVAIDDTHTHTHLITIKPHLDFSRPEYLSRQISGKGWKPSLDPIKEKTTKAKVRHWVF